ncbi:hypothetical protein DMUE_3812 [Dictyocoela muelleri]|nr:hypothetical protein DMUE_3812 [Dictyocoela muelleri]
MKKSHLKFFRNSIADLAIIILITKYISKDLSEESQLDFNSLKSDKIMTHLNTLEIIIKPKNYLLVNQSRELRCFISLSNSIEEENAKRVETILDYITSKIDQFSRFFRSVIRGITIF